MVRAINRVVAVAVLALYLVLLLCFFFVFFCLFSFFFQAEDGIRDLVRSRGLGDVYKRQGWTLPLLLAWSGCFALG